MEKSINFIVEEEEKNLRVDVLINKRDEIISRTRVKNLILKEKLKLNNEIIKSWYSLIIVCLLNCFDKFSWVSLFFATTTKPEVFLSILWTIPGLNSSPIVDKDSLL